MSVLPVRERVHVLPKTVISRYSNAYAKKQKRLGIILLPLAYQGHLHILEYLVERKFEKYDACACMLAVQERPLRMFEVLTRNRQSALGLSRVRKAREQPTRICTIPPRQRLPFTISLDVRARRFNRDRIRIRIIIRIIIIIVITQIQLKHL